MADTYAQIIDALVGWYSLEEEIEIAELILGFSTYYPEG